MFINNTINEKFDQAGFSEAQKFTVRIHLITAFSAEMGHVPYVEEGERIYGNLCSVLCGSTGHGKGSACRFVNGILSGFGEDTLAPRLEMSQVTSMKALVRAIHNILSDNVREIRGEIRIHHINEEFGQELRSAASSYQSGLGPIVCKLIEGNRIHETLGRQEISYPLIHYSFIGHIQPEELKRCMRPHLITSGFANRFLLFELPPDMTLPLPSLS